MSDDPTQQPDVGVHTVVSDTPLHAGAVVYRVIEVDPPPNVPGPYTWQAGTVIVERASDKQIKLKRTFPGLARLVFEPSAFGHYFFKTPEQAIQAFLTARRNEIVALDYRRKIAERALAWAEGQVQALSEGQVPA
jgi:hypothetical protein